MGRRGALLYTMLAYPTGRLTRRGAGCGAGYQPAGTHALPPHGFISEQYVLPFPLTTCTSDCPTNAFMLTGSEPAFLGEVEILRDLLVVLVFTAAVSLLALRIRRATPLIRPMLVPLLAAAIVRLVAAAVYQPAVNYPDSAFTEVVGWIAAFAFPAMSIAFLVGLVYWRLVEARMLEQVTAVLRSDLGPEGLESLLSGSGLGASVRVLYRVPAPQGNRISGQMASADRATARTGLVRGHRRIPVRREQGRGGARGDAPGTDELPRGDRLLRDCLARVRATSTALDSSLHEVAASRARISAAADEERRRERGPAWT